MEWKVEFEGLSVGNEVWAVPKGIVGGGGGGGYKLCGEQTLDWPLIACTACSTTCKSGWDLVRGDLYPAKASFPWKYVPVVLLLLPSRSTISFVSLFSSHSLYTYSCFLEVANVLNHWKPRCVYSNKNFILKNRFQIWCEPKCNGYFPMLILHELYVALMWYNLATLCLNGTHACDDFMHLTMKDLPI